MKKCKKNILKIFQNTIDKVDFVWYNNGVAGMAQSVEHVIGNDEVISSILITSSKKRTSLGVRFFVLFFLLKLAEYSVFRFFKANISISVLTIYRSCGIIYPI